MCPAVQSRSVPARAYRRAAALSYGVGVAVNRRLENAREQRRRVVWPTATSNGDRLVLVVANHNAVDLIVQLVFGIHRVLEPGEVHHLIVVDNASTDGSVELLEEMQDAGLLTLVRRFERPYHGPGLNAGLSFLAERQGEPRYRADVVGVMDSDVLALRPGGLRAAIDLMRQSRAAMTGPARGEMVPFYAHPSLLLFDPAAVWRRGVPVFVEHGAPGIPMQEHLRREDVGIVTFPFYKFRFFLHLGHGTVRNLDGDVHKANRYHPWARTGLHLHYEQDPSGPLLHQLWLEAFERETAGTDLVEACLRSERVDVLKDRNPHTI